ncbi:hypothetical protein [Lysinibacillus pakistanensis]|uniref:Uncharacterized protein n=1 Tax=Lysinibacillus pakistanensis TaxID=759811 RepID=A0ABX6DA32_9BACI|nr:hypothetical protein GDS87_12200 [Lysinibacillus pakistanensis]
MTDMAIELVYKEVLDDNPKLPSSHEVASWPVMETILQKPLTGVIVSMAGQSNHRLLHLQLALPIIMMLFS